MATEYISRDAMHKANRYEWDGVCGDYDGHQIFIDNESMIDSIPAEDVVEVVRCRDCIYGDPDPSTSSEIFCEKHCRWLNKDHYCADGKRREPHD